jgi:hypothetical protein
MIPSAQRRSCRIFVLRRAPCGRCKGLFGRCLARMALYAWGQSASSLAARGRFLLYFRELWQLIMTSKTCLG